MSKTKSILFFVLCYFVGYGQIQHGGSPISLSLGNLPQEVPMITAPPINIQALHEEDEVVDLIKDIPWRYGYIHYVNASLQDGVFEALPNGDRVWRLKINSVGAQTLNLTFDVYKLAPGAQLFIYNENYNDVLGSFTSENNKDHGFLTTTLIKGDLITVELYEPQAVVGLSALHLQRVVHGYRALDYQKKYIGDSGNCNNNVVCPEGDSWRDQIRSVGILLSQNNLSAGFCTGALINNSCSDGKPYFLTANHCGADDPTTLVGFNFESTACNSNAGPYVNNTVSGVTKRANNGGSDFMLLELSSAPPANYNVYYAGWDRSGTTTAGQVGVHHPAGDVKKISFDNQSATQANYSGAQCWRIGAWEDGTTEGGSSGSPLFNLNGNIIGQLYGGSASCSSITNDFYGRFDISWDNGTGPSNELKTWLDACNTNLPALSGYDPNAIVLNEDAFLSFSGAPSEALCADKIEQKLILRNKGAQVLTSAQILHGITGNLNTYNWNGLLNANESATISLDSLVLTTGVYTYEAYIVNTNLNLDQNPSNDSTSFMVTIANGTNIAINLTTNYEASQNLIEVRDGAGTLLELEDGFSNTTSYTFSYCLQPGSYCVKITDTGANGLSPIWFFDQGNYQLNVGGVEIYNDDNIESGYEYCFVVAPPPTGILNKENIIHFDLYPNPNTGSFNLSSSVVIEKMEIYNLVGEMIQTQQIASQQASIQTKDFAKGVYFVKIYTAKGTGMEKMLLK